MIHPDVYNDLRGCADRFELGYLKQSGTPEGDAFLQAARRLLILYDADMKKIGHVRESMIGYVPPKTTGEFCNECGSANLVRTGTCKTCQDCGRNEGCG